MTPPLDVAAVRDRYEAWFHGNPFSNEGHARAKASASDVPALLDALEAAQAEVERLRAETVPRSALVHRGWSCGTARMGHYGETCPLHESRLCESVYVLRSTQEGDGDGRVGDEIGAT